MTPYLPKHRASVQATVARLVEALRTRRRFQMRAQSRWLLLPADCKSPHFFADATFFRKKGKKVSLIDVSVAVTSPQGVHLPPPLTEVHGTLRQQFIKQRPS
jgi:hypothetical protein